MWKTQHAIVATRQSNGPSAVKRTNRLVGEKSQDTTRFGQIEFIANHLALELQDDITENGASLSIEKLGHGHSPRTCAALDSTAPLRQVFGPHAGRGFGQRA